MNTALATPTPLTIPDVKNFVAIVRQNVRKFGAKPVMRTRRQGQTLLAEPFTIDKGEVAPTMKLKRKAINQKFSQAIDAMYTE